MKSRFNIPFWIFRDKLQFFVVSILAIMVVGTVIIDSYYLSKKIIFPQNGALDMSFEMSSTKVQTTKDINNIENVHLIVLKVNLKNNAPYPLTNVKLIVANTGIGTLETPSALRFQHLAPNTSGSAFAIPDIPAGGQRSSEILLYANESGMYATKVFVENNEKVKSSTNLISFVAE